MRRELVVALLLLAIASTEAFARSAGTWQRTITAADGALSELEILIPFYEGIQVRAPTVTLKEVGQDRLRLAYPGVLSLPLFAWRFGQASWTAVYAPALDASPAELRISAEPSSLRIELDAFAGAAFQTDRIAGDSAALAAALRARWHIRPRARPLAPRFTAVHFYVHQWVSSDRDPPLQMNWTIDELVQHMKTERPETIQFVYGFDPSGVDIGGRYFWGSGSEFKVRQVLLANPQLSFMNWLNLRTYKTAIPRLGIERPMTAEIRAMLRQYPGGTKPAEGSFRSVDMCLASREWQHSRLREFDRLADLGFRVIQIDEFPIPRLWHTQPCLAHHHLHKSNDIVDEWRHVARFLRQLADRARRKDVLLTCEEPSGALLPYVAGYIDRMFNASIDIYRMWRNNARVLPTPFFSAVFGDMVTPYTDADEAEPARRPPAGWLKQHKLYPRRLAQPH
jgi:hypothetical protein